jgi:hypothetical protein
MVTFGSDKVNQFSWSFLVTSVTQDYLWMLSWILTCTVTAELITFSLPVAWGTPQAGLKNQRSWLGTGSVPPGCKEVIRSRPSEQRRETLRVSHVDSVTRSSSADPRSGDA